MTCRICDETPCVCDRTGSGTTNGKIRSTYTPAPHGITEEEFGLNLYAAIKTIGGLLAVQDQINAAVHRGQPYDRQVATRDKLKAELVPVMTKLKAGEVAEILDRYPFVATL